MRTHWRVGACMRAGVRVCVWARLCVCACVRVFMCVCVRACVRLRVYMCVEKTSDVDVRYMNEYSTIILPQQQETAFHGKS